MALCVGTGANNDKGEMENHSPKFLWLHYLFPNLILLPEPEPGWPTGKAKQCCISFYKHMYWKQTPTILENAWTQNIECFLKKSFQYLEGEWMCFWGNRSLSQKFLLEGWREREKKRDRKREREGQAETHSFPREPKRTQPCPSFRIPWKASRKCWCLDCIPPVVNLFDLAGIALVLVCFQSSTGDSNVQSGLNITKLAVPELSPSRWKRKPQEQRQLSTWQWLRLRTALCSLHTSIALRGAQSVPFTSCVQCQWKPSSHDQCGANGHRSWGRRRAVGKEPTSWALKTFCLDHISNS